MLFFTVWGGGGVAFSFITHCESFIQENNIKFMFLVLYLDAVRGNGGDKAELSSVFMKLTVEEGR